MPGGTACMPLLANEDRLAEESIKLRNHLQIQLEEDIARIFDESIHPDLEIVCGKLNILTHSCILQARTKQFYRKLTTVLNLYIEKHAYDEVYSFISDAYTECNIKSQEQQIIKYLDQYKDSSTLESQYKKGIDLDHDFLNTLKCGTETTVRSTHKVPPDPYFCDRSESKKQLNISSVQTNGGIYCEDSIFNNDVVLDSVISFDSLITEEHSFMSENCSSVYTLASGFDCISEINKQYHRTMENNISVSDSGVESNDFLESNISSSSQKDATLTDIVLDGITSNSTTLNEATYSAYPTSSETNLHGAVDTPPAAQSGIASTATHIGLAQKPCHIISNEVSYKSSKEEKQRQNEEIVILESSSISSETGSWESVFPPKLTKKNNPKSVNIEPQQKYENQTSTHLTTSCFIDAASLVEPEYEEQISVVRHLFASETKKPNVLKLSQPIPCYSSKMDASPSDWSETNENDDSLEQSAKNEHCTDQKIVSPTIFEMTPISEDSCTRVFENLPNEEILHNDETKTFNQGSKYEFNSSMLHANEDKSITRMQRYNESCPVVSGGACVEDHLPQTKSETESPIRNRKTDNTSKMLSAPAWVVDMSTTEPEHNHALEGDDARNIIKDENIQTNENYEESDSNDKSGQKFFIDLKSLPDSTASKLVPPTENMTDKKNIFSMYIDFGDNLTVKDMPPRLSNSLNIKKYDFTPNKTKSPKVSIVSRQTPSTGKSTIVFEEFENLCSNPDISISEIINLASLKVSSKFSNKEIQDEKNKEIEKFTEKSEDLFVKLSDLDKPVSKLTVVSDNCDKMQTDVRLTRSIPDNDWENQVATETPRSIDVMNSFHSENARSLNRLFPHLRTELSKSMPGSLSKRIQLPFRTAAASSLDVHEQLHDASELSSVQSSMLSDVGSCSTEESSQMSNLIGTCQSKLGQDLLRMFLEEIAPDVVVEVSGRRIKAHKCILSSRCQYFAAILSGGWVESAGNVIVLPPFSFNVVQFALCHIYAGVSTIPESISILELATLADMLGLEGLIEVITLTLKAKYCHFFHTPCSVCIAGVMECFPLSSVYGLDDLYHKCMRWITKYFSIVWPTKAFATLPKELLERCYQQVVVHLSCDNLVDTVYGCGITVWNLQRNRWAETVARLCQRLMSAAARLAASHLLSVLQHIDTLPDETMPYCKHALDDCIAAAIEWAPPDELCTSYAFLSDFLRNIRLQNYTKPDLIRNGNSKKVPFHSSMLFTHASRWRLQCEGALVRSAPRIVGTQAFKDLPVELRKRLRDLGCIMYGMPTSLPPSSDQDKKSPSNKTNTALCQQIDVKLMQSSFVPYVAKPKKAENLSTSEAKRPSMQNPPKIRTTKAHEQRARYNLLKNNQSSKNQTTRPVSAINTKSSCVTSKTSKESEKITANNKIISKMVSSTESSRNSSPIQAGSLRSSRLKTDQSAGDRACTMSQDNLVTSRPQTAEPSTDSLNEIPNGNKYATYTKTKHSSTPIKLSENKPPKEPHVGDSKKPRTRIPVFIGQNTNKINNTNKCTKVLQNKTQDKPANGGKQSPQKVAATSKHRKTTERMRAPGSLMNATKSSSAKMVTSVKNDQYKCKNSNGEAKSALNTGKIDECVEASDIAVMERSGTFLKDEPTFGDKITNFDIDK